MRETLTDERLEVLREAYQHLVDKGERRFNGDRISMDRENLSIVKELQFFRSLRCPECEGLGFIENPDARYEMEYVEHLPTGIYSTLDEEEIDCPRCGGSGFCNPVKEPVRLQNKEPDHGDPF